MILPTGITGFYIFKDKPPPNVDKTKFASVIHEVARTTRGEIKKVFSEWDDASRSYIGVLLEFEGPTRTVLILVNRHYPFIGFAEEPKSLGQVRFNFRDEPALAKEFEKFGFNAINKTRLEKILDKNDISQLSTVEKEHISLDSTTVGEAIFNWWD